MLMIYRIVDVNHGTCTRVDKPPTRLKCLKEKKTSKIIGAALAAPAAPVPTPLTATVIVRKQCLFVIFETGAKTFNY